MKVLNVTISLNPKGGGWPERTRQMNSALADKGVGCVILTFDEGYSYCADHVQIKALPCPLKGAKIAFFPPVFSLPRIHQLVRDTDVVHLMGFRSFLNVVVYLVAKRIGKKVAVCPAGSIPSYGSRLNRLSKSIFDSLIGYSMAAGVDACIAVTEKERGQLLSYGFNPSKTEVIPNGVHEKDFTMSDNNVFRSKFGLGDSPFILFMGRLSHIKGPDLLLQAFAEIHRRFPEVHLVFAGSDAGMQSELISMSSHFGLEHRVHLLGHIGQPDKSFAYHAASLLVIPSRQEAMSIVALEAGMCGLPVLLTDECGLNDIAQIGGGLVASASVKGIAEGLGTLLADLPRLQQMGESLRAFVRSNYAWDSVVDRYIRMYAHLLDAEGV